MAVEATSFQHSLLGQTSTSDGPSGEHFQHSSVYRFPHEDSNGKCWQPDGYEPKSDFSGNENWLDYEDSVSQIMRAECELQSWMSVCQIPLYWEPVDCNIYIDRAAREAAGRNAEPELKDWQKGMVPLWIVIPVQILSAIWKGLAIGIVALPWWLLLATLAAFDWVLDWVFLLTFGLFCVPCAGFFIWVVNIAMIPFTIWGWLMRFFLETFGLIIDGWMLLLGGSGCYLNWGHQCWFKKDRSLRHILDIPLFFTKPSNGGVDNIKDALINSLTPQRISKRSEIIHVRRQNRKNFLAAIPILAEITQMMDYAYMNVDF